AHLAAGIIADEVQPDIWLVVTSLVQRDQLAEVFDNSLPWQLEGVREPLREALCKLQGMKLRSN
ncbi:hypothetical protein B4Q13_22420, partial [Lacticaseibacillus rhamnosus]